MLKQRVITALWGIPLLIAIVWFGEPWFSLVAAMWGVLAAFEFYRLVAAAKATPLTYFGLTWVLLFILSPHLQYEFILPVLLTSMVILPLIWLILRQPRENAFVSWAWTVAGILYLGWLLSHLVALRGLDDGRNWVFLALFANFASDTSAFFAGRAWGRHLLAPSVSPAKTWEGAVAGVFGAIIVSLLLTIPSPISTSLTYWQAILLGLAISVFGQLGDLAESLFK